MSGGVPAVAASPDMADVIAQIRSSYDRTPYVSHPFPQSAPEQLAAVATLFGLTPPPVATARVLELGCAAGGNLLPIAFRHPGCEVVGIDLSPVQIAQGRCLIEAAGLRNAQLIEGDLSAIGLLPGKFDYVVCHGVYSWVPPQVQAAILRICREHLCEHGVAYVSYNCYPGWKTKEIIRDAMRLRGGADRAQNAPLAYARGMVDFLRQVSLPESLMTRILAEHAPLIDQADNYYLEHEYLEACNAPCYLLDFVAAANSVGLAYLGDARPSGMFVHNYGEQVATPILAECGHSQIELEQYLDFVVNRGFRETLLVHANQAERVHYQLEPGRLRCLHLAARLPAREPVVLDGSAQSFGEADASPFVLASPAAKAAALALDQAWPGTCDFEALANAAQAATGMPLTAQDELDLQQLVELLVIGGRGRLRSEPVRTSAIDPQYPCVPEAWRRYAEASAATGAASVVDLWHQPVMLGLAETRLALLADGTRDRATLAAALVAAVAGNALVFMENQAVVIGDAAVQAHAERLVARFCERLADHPFGA